MNLPTHNNRANDSTVNLPCTVLRVCSWLIAGVNGWCCKTSSRRARLHVREI